MSAPPRSAGSPRDTRRPPGAEVLGISLTPAELERTALLFCLLFLAALMLVVGRSARDALFLTRFPVSWIAPMWIAYAVASSLAALAYARVADRLPRARFAVAFALFAAATYAVLRVLIGHEVRAAYLVFYVWSEIIANFTAVLAWAIAQDLHDPRSAKRLFGLIGTGRVVGTVLCGFATGGFVTLLGTENLLVVLIGALLAVAVVARILALRHPAPPQPTGAAEALEARLRRTPVRRSSYAVLIALLALLLFTVLTIGDYQFKAVARTAYPDRDDLARFMGFFYGSIGALGLVVQLFVTPRLLQRHGVLGGMVVMPAAFVASTLAFLASPSLALASLLKASDNGLQFTLHDATMQLLFFPFSPALRERVRTLVSAVAKPLGYGLGAVGLIVFAPAAATPPPGPALVDHAARLGLLSLPLGLLVLALLPAIRRGYIDAMRRTLLRRDTAPEGFVYGPHTRAIFAQALRSADAPQALFAIEQLRALDPDLVSDNLPALARHRAGRVRAVAVRLAAELAHPDGPALARAALRDKRAPVRVAAVDALAALVREDAHDDLVAIAGRLGADPAAPPPPRGDPSALVRAAAVAALVRHGGLDGVLDGAPRLRALLDSAAPRDRATAARILGMVGHASLQRALARLLSDPDPAVRAAAVRASSNVADPRLLPRLADALAERAVAPAATRAIAALGEDAVPLLAARLADRATPRAARLVIPRVLARIGTTDALGALLERIDEPDEAVRQKALASASRLRLALRAPPAPLPAIGARIDHEIDAHVRARDAYIAVRPRLAGQLLDQHQLRRLRKGLIRVLRLCELSYPREVVALVRTNIFGQDPALRANAFEVLESMLDRPLRERLVALVERYIELRAAFPAVRRHPPEATAVAWIRAEIARGDPYGAALALDAIAQHAVAAAADDALAATADPDPLVREAAAIALAVTRPPGAAERLAALLHDEDPAVTRYAQYWAATGRTGIGPDDTMFTTIEKVLFLQRVPIFARVAGDDLVGLARGSLVVALQKGDVIFRQGEPGGALYSIISGEVSLTIDGREIARLLPNDVFGEMSIFDKEPRVSTAVVAEDAELLRVSAEDFHDAVRETVEIAEAVIQVMNRRLRQADRRLAEARARLSAAASRAAALPSEAPAPPADGPRAEDAARRADEPPLDDNDLD